MRTQTSPRMPKHEAYVGEHSDGFSAGCSCGWRERGGRTDLGFSEAEKAAEDHRRTHSGKGDG